MPVLGLEGVRVWVWEWARQLRVIGVWCDPPPQPLAVRVLDAQIVWVVLAFLLPSSSSTYFKDHVSCAAVGVR